MAGHQREADAAVVEEDPGGAGHQVGPEIEGVGLGQRDAEAPFVDGTQVGGVAVAEPWDRTVWRRGDRAHVGRCGPVAEDAAGGGPEAAPGEE
jgi:hypothetical protein